MATMHGIYGHVTNIKFYDIIYSLYCVLSVQFEAQDVMVPWHLQPKYRDRRPPLPHPQPGGTRAKQNKPRKQRKRKTKDVFSGVESDGSEPVTSRAQSDMVGESFLELSAISLYSDDEDVGQQTKREGNCHGTSRLPDPAAGSELPLTGQDREKHPSPGVSSCCYKPTITGNIDGTGIGTNAGTCGSNRVGDTAAGPASCPTVTVRDNTASQPTTEVEQLYQVAATCGTSTESDVVDSQNTTLVEQGYQTFQRYYHVFKRGELSELFAGVQRVKVLEEFYDHENWCVLAQKSCESPLHTLTI